ARLTDSLELGLGYQLAFDTHNEGTLTTPGLATFNSNYPQNKQLGLNPAAPTAQVEIDLPMIIRGGVRLWRPRWDAELDVVYEGWSANQAWKVHIPGAHIVGGPFGMTGNAVPDLEIQKSFQDSVSIRAGGDWWANESLTLRGGAFYETSGVPAARIDV